MENDSLRQLEKTLRRIFVLLGLAAIAGVVLLLRFDNGGPPAVESMTRTAEAETEYDWEAGLADSTYWLPENCNLYDVLPDISFVNREGRRQFIKQWRGKPAVLIFWASWCGDCQEQMELMAEFEKIAEDYGEIPLLFINKTDGEKETEETASAYFDSLGLASECYFDPSLRAYSALGIHNIPTAVFLDENGRVGAWSPKSIGTAGVFEALLRNAVEGSGKATETFVTEKLMGEDGGIRSGYAPEGKAAQGDEVLSESQGLFLLYTAKNGNKELFDRTYGYVESCLWPESALPAWRAEAGVAGGVNALIDDLRIYKALLTACERWGGYDTQLKRMETALRQYGLYKNRYVDFYDAENKAYASRFTLCYADLEAMEALAGRDEAFGGAMENARMLLEKGQISSEFPLYYSWYNYDKKRYEEDDLNTAEAMLTLLHLAEAGQLKENTVNWLKTQMSGEGLKARYTVKGEPVKGYGYDSTAVYAEVVMIADKIGDDTLRGQALRKMEKMRINDVSLPYNGAFGMEGGSGITSFDQLMPLLAYTCIGEP